MSEQSYPKVLVNSVPKSGTNLLIQMLQGIPGLKISGIEPQGIHESNFDSLKQLQPGGIAYGHIYYTPQRAQQLCAWNIKHLFLYRDLRDVAVSLMHFIMDRLPHDPMHAYLHRLKNQEARLEAILAGVAQPNFQQPDIYRLYLPIYGWWTVPQLFSLTFEELRQSPHTRRQALGRVIDYLGVEPITGISKPQLIARMESQANPRTSWTYRRGEIGSWRKAFTPRHKALFKQLTKDFLVRLGYETDLRW
jgi:hypothetical protein